jgi:hypothetical protein
VTSPFLVNCDFSQSFPHLNPLIYRNIPHLQSSNPRNFQNQQNQGGQSVDFAVSASTLETMESIARALEVEIKDLFEFAHLQAGGVKAEDIEKLLEGVDEEKSRRS